MDRKTKGDEVRGGNISTSAILEAQKLLQAFTGVSASAGIVYLPVKRRHLPTYFRNMIFAVFRGSFEYRLRQKPEVHDKPHRAIEMGMKHCKRHPYGPDIQVDDTHYSRKTSQDSSTHPGASSPVSFVAHSPSKDSPTCIYPLDPSASPKVWVFLGSRRRCSGSEGVGRPPNSPLLSRMLDQAVNQESAPAVSRSRDAADSPAWNSDCVLACM